MDTPVDVVALDYDFWYELGKADGELEPGEGPELNNDGWLYYVRFRHALEQSEPTWADSPGFRSVEEAMAYAESKVEGGVAWDDAAAT